MTWENIRYEVHCDTREKGNPTKERDFTKRMGENWTSNRKTKDESVSRRNCVVGLGRSFEGIAGQE